MGKREHQRRLQRLICIKYLAQSSLISIQTKLCTYEEVTVKDFVTATALTFLSFAGSIILIKSDFMHEISAAPL